MINSYTKILPTVNCTDGKLIRVARSLRARILERAKIAAARWRLTAKAASSHSTISIVCRIDFPLLVVEIHGGIVRKSRYSTKSAVSAKQVYLHVIVVSEISDKNSSAFWSRFFFTFFFLYFSKPFHPLIVALQKYFFPLHLNFRYYFFTIAYEKKKWFLCSFEFFNRRLA